MTNSQAAQVHENVPAFAVHGEAARGARSPWLFGWCTASVLCILSPILFISATPNPVGSLWVGSLTVVVVAGGRYSWLIGRGERRLVETSVMLFTYVFLGLAPMVQLRTGVEPSTTPGLVAESNLKASALIIAGLVAFLAGSTTWIKGPPSRVPQPSLVSTNRMYVLTGASVLMSLYYISSTGFGSFFTNRSNLSNVTSLIWPSQTTKSLIQAAAVMGLTVSFVGLCALRRQLVHTRRPIHTILPISILALLLVEVNPITSPRYIFGTTLLSIIAALGLYSTRQRFRLAALGAVAGFVFVFPIADAFRNSDAGNFATGGPVNSLLSGDFDAYAQISNAALYVDGAGPTYGRQALGVVFFWVPRDMWPDKPADTGVLLAESRDYAFTNLSAPLWAELYVNGSWLLLIGGMYAFGRIARSSDRAIEGQISRAGAAGVIGTVLPFYLIIVIRGSLLQAMAFLTVIVVAALFIKDWTAREKEAEPR